MEIEQAMDVLAGAFRGLEGEAAGWREHFAFHLAQATPICCGESAFWFADGRGAG